MSKEGFQPISNVGPEGGSWDKFRFYGRMVIDFQTLTVLRHLRQVLPHYKGEVLDVGCGLSPYRFLLDKSKTKYYGIDIMEADRFNYHNTDITSFNGEDIPFEDEKFDGLICTEVLEHVEKYQRLIDEMHRVMKTGGTGFITVPWSARYHYIPWDFFRYTPSTLKIMFSKFSEVKIMNRGTDYTVIANKVIVIFIRNLLPVTAWKLIFVPVWIMLSPILSVVAVVGQLSVWFGLGANEDPLGYTIVVKK
jgi:ubiquinone/menaquinone biosynthesis C-methylase UbiE